MHNARALRDAYRALVARGIDPRAHRRQACNARSLARKTPS
ncbi:hypothetical protein [Pseudomonas sp. MWU13-2105]|nr:hypothetical protein [Pseudomonas sp. MWU13-2105]